MTAKTTSNVQIPTNHKLFVVGIKTQDYLSGEAASAFMRKLTVRQREIIMEGHCVYLSRGRQAYLVANTVAPYSA